MKILYIAPERAAAALAARALRGIAPNVALAWAQTPGAALEWLQGNRDAAAVIVEVQAQSCGPFVDQLRGLGLTTPVVVVMGSAQLEPAVAALNAGAQGYVVAGPSFDTELPRIVGLAMDRERGRGELLRTLKEVEASRDRAEQGLARAEEAREQADQRGASELAAATKQLADLQALHTASVAREARISTALQHRLFELESALRNADERRASEAVVFADQLAKRHAEFTASLTHTAEARDSIAAQLTAATAALEEAQRARTADAAAAAERLRRREAELNAAVAEAVAARTTLEGALAGAEAAHREAQQRAESDLTAANERQAALEDLLAQEVDRRAGLEQKLVAADAALDDADRRQAAEMTRAAARLEEVQARCDAALAETAAVREMLARREAELGAQLADAKGASTEHAAACAALERHLAETMAAYQRADERAATALAAAAAREAELVEGLTRETDARAALERNLAAVSAETARARRRFLQVVSAYRRRAQQRKARLEAQLAGERADAERGLREKDEEIRQIDQERETLAHMLRTAQDQVQHLHNTVEEDRQASERARLASESELQRVSAEYGQLRQSFDRLQSAFQTLEQIAGEHAAERARLEMVVADRDRALSEQAERHRLAAQGAQDAHAQRQQTLEQTIEMGAAEARRLQQECDALRRELDAARTHTEALRGEAERVPVLHAQLERSQRERRGDFERAPYAICQCTQNGVIIDANHSFVRLVGCRRVEELRNMDFGAVVDPAGDLDWLLEQVRAGRKTEPVEAIWNTRDGRDRIVRLHASATPTGSVEIVVTDVTDVRALEERLRKAYRMEAAGRLASEVAATCDALLRDAIRRTQEWLASEGADDALRREGERLLADVTRAASFLRQLGVYGGKEVRALEPVSVQRVLQDLAPVLKRVVGDEVELVLPKSSGSFDVDVQPERLERVLVNLAGYARQRMPGGGEMRVDLEAATVGRRLVAGNPNVRPGHSVLITVTELPRDGVFHGDAGTSAASDKPGVELATLVDLVGACGGHLWMEAQPAGNMVVKIHLPKPVAADATEATSDARSDRGRLARWFRPGSATSGVRT
jgi:PAS domain S-box-containing protein